MDFLAYVIIPMGVFQCSNSTPTPSQSCEN
nr:MAG TPA: hypothetical protein [Bacteriophage sp.]